MFFLSKYFFQYKDQHQCIPSQQDFSPFFCSTPSPITYFLWLKYKIITGYWNNFYTPELSLELSLGASPVLEPMQDQPWWEPVISHLTVTQTAGWWRDEWGHGGRWQGDISLWGKMGIREGVQGLLQNWVAPLWGYFPSHREGDYPKEMVAVTWGMLDAAAAIWCCSSPALHVAQDWAVSIVSCLWY